MTVQRQCEYPNYLPIVLPIRLKKDPFCETRKNNSGSEKTQNAKKQGVIANPLSSLIYRKTRSPFFKTGGLNRSPTLERKYKEMLTYHFLPV
jgi:hypothetical protein